MNIDDVLRSGNAVRKWLDNGSGPVIMKWLDEWQRETVTKLRSVGDLSQMHRMQGELAVLDRILGLKVEIDRYQEAVRSGKIKKIGD